MLPYGVCATCTPNLRVCQISISGESVFRTLRSSKQPGHVAQVRKTSPCGGGGGRRSERGKEGGRKGGRGEKEGGREGGRQGGGREGGADPLKTLPAATKGKEGGANPMPPGGQGGSLPTAGHQLGIAETRRVSRARVSRALFARRGRGEICFLLVEVGGGV